MTQLQQLQKRLAELDAIQARSNAEDLYRRGLGPRPAGSLSNAVIQRRNGGVRPQFVDSIGGDSSNYR